MLFYSKVIIHYGVRYVGDGELIVKGFVDFDWAGDVGDGISTSDCCFSLELVMISWFIRKQTSVALS